jgi:hypothetical protein
VLERAGNTLELMGIGNDLLNRSQMFQQLRERGNNWDYMKLQSFGTKMEMVTRLKRQPKQREKIFASMHLTRD